MGTVSTHSTVVAEVPAEPSPLQQYFLLPTPFWKVAAIQCAQVLISFAVAGWWILQPENIWSWITIGIFGAITISLQIVHHLRQSKCFPHNWTRDIQHIFPESWQGFPLLESRRVYLTTTHIIVRRNTWWFSGRMTDECVLPLLFVKSMDKYEEEVILRLVDQHGQKAKVSVFPREPDQLCAAIQALSVKEQKRSAGKISARKSCQI